MKELKDYTQEELQSILVTTKANILDTQENYKKEMEMLIGNRQIIEGELKKRKEEIVPEELGTPGKKSKPVPVIKK